MWFSNPANYCWGSVELNYYRERPFDSDIHLRQIQAIFDRSKVIVYMDHAGLKYKDAK